MTSKMTKRFLLAAGAALCVATSASATLMINEVFTNPPGTDDTQEFFEIKSSTGGVESMSGLTLLILEGEGTAAGSIDVALSLSSFSTGSNGLFYWQANTAVSSISPTPNAASTVNTADFNPDLENGTQTYLLVAGYSGTAGTDLDANNDGTLDSTPWTSVVDAIGARDNTVADITYAGSLSFTDLPTLPANFDLEYIFRIGNTNDWVAADIGGTNPGGPYSLDATETVYANGSAVPVASLDFDDVSPGNFNPALVAVPEASAFWFGGAICGVIGLWSLRQRRKVEAGLV